MYILANLERKCLLMSIESDLKKDGITVIEPLDITTVNVIAKNVSKKIIAAFSNLGCDFDTLYERTFAEALNFHLRSPRMVLGEVYMIILKEYNSDAAANHQVAFNNSEYIEKYILAFQALNDRINIEDPLYKYERIALLIVDFSQPMPKLYNTTQELIQDGLLNPNSVANIDRLSFPTFIQDLFNIYQTRFPENSFS